MHSGVQSLKVLFKLLTVVLPRDASDPRCSVLLRSQVRLTQPIDAHVVQQRREPSLLIRLCSFAYTFDIYGISRFSRKKVPHMCRVCDRAGPFRDLRLRL
jgi:hypothetical protein